MLGKDTVHWHALATHNILQLYTLRVVLLKKVHGILQLRQCLDEHFKTTVRRTILDHRFNLLAD